MHILTGAAFQNLNLNEHILAKGTPPTKAEKKTAKMLRR